MKHTCKPTAQDVDAAGHHRKFKTSLIYTAEKRRESSSSRRKGDEEKGEVGRRKRRKQGREG